MIMKALTDSIRKKLSWLECKVIVENMDTQTNKYYNAKRVNLRDSVPDFQSCDRKVLLMNDSFVTKISINSVRNIKDTVIELSDKEAKNLIVTGA